MKRTLFLLISAVFFAVSTYFLVQTYSQSDKFQRYKLAYTSELNFESSLLDMKDYLNSEEWSQTQAKSTETWKKAYRAKHSADNYALVLGGIIALYFLLFLALFRFNILTSNQLGFALLNSSLVCLSAGIVLPFMELGAFMQDLHLDIGYGIAKTFDGKIYFFYQSKTVLQLIGTLFSNGSILVAISIGMFSVIFPFSKIALFYSFLFSKKKNEKEKLLKISSYIGKYSMADVFVAACFLAFLSFNNLQMAIQTESATLPGLYFFLGYCLISISTYFAISHRQNKSKKELTQY